MRIGFEYLKNYTRLIHCGSFHDLNAKIPPSMKSFVRDETHWTGIEKFVAMLGKQNLPVCPSMNGNVPVLPERLDSIGIPV